MPGDHPLALYEVLFACSLLAHLIQWTYYWKKLPSSLTVHYDIDGEPALQLPKPLVFCCWAIIVATAAVLLYIARQDQSLAYASVIILFLLAVMQLLINANRRGGKLSMIGLVGVVAMFIVLVQLTVKR